MVVCITRALATARCFRYIHLKGLDICNFLPHTVPSLPKILPFLPEWLPDDWIAAAHVCACNPRKLPHYPSDWYALSFEIPSARRDMLNHRRP